MIGSIGLKAKITHKKISIKKISRKKKLLK